ncbi:MAG: hypothetical protein K8R53_09585 [Bacteroidales bacterium]|nr:hypothetical protein [Bacteroidales bacterium]
MNNFYDNRKIFPLKSIVRCMTICMLVSFSAAQGQELQQFTTDFAEDIDPFWSPDGTKLVFWTNRDIKFHIWGKEINGGNATQITNHNGNDKHPCFVLDGAMIAFDSDYTGNDDIWIIYPNPSDGIIYLSKNSQLSDYYKITVLELTGEIIY